MKRIEAALFVNGKPTRGILEQFEATDQTFVTSGEADGITSTLNLPIVPGEHSLLLIVPFFSMMHM